MSEAVSGFGNTTPKVRHIGIDRPWVWLACGWQDLARQPAVRYLHRPANLEDLFLKLTGRQIRDDA